MSDSRISCFHELFASAQVSSAWVQSMVEYHRTTPHYSWLNLFRPLFLNKEAKIGLLLLLHIPSYLWTGFLNIKMEGLHKLREYSYHKTLCLCSCSAVLNWMQLEHAIYLSKLDVE